MKTRYIIGTSGWNYPHWKKRFYPEDIYKKDWFSYYTKRFDSVEINSTFYRWPKQEQLKNWQKEAPVGFSYTIKAPQYITHMKRLKDPETHVSQFYATTDLLKQKKGCHLFQLPPSFKNDERNRTRLKAFMKALGGRKDNAIEFRDVSWWTEEIYRLCETYNVIFCSVIGLGMPEKFITTADKAYIRFHGEHYDTRYTKQQIKDFARSIEYLRCKKVYIYFNNDAYAYAPQNAQELKGELNA
jgi:uncharacterized protein YecE (DUF72 family)